MKHFHLSDRISTNFIVIKLRNLITEEWLTHKGKTMLKGKQKNLPAALKKKIVAAAMKKKKKKTA